MRKGFLWVVMGLSGLLALALALGTSPNNLPAPSPPSALANSTWSPSPQSPNPYISLSPEKIIEQGRSLDKRVADGNNPKLLNKHLPLIKVEEIEQTRRALESISTGPQHDEAARLLKSLDKRDEEGKKAKDAYLAKAHEE